MADRLASYLAVMTYGLVISKLAFLNGPPILLGLCLLLSAAVAWVDRKQTATQPSVWGWRVRQSVAPGVSFCLLLPLCVILSLYYSHTAKVIHNDSFLRFLISSSVSLMLSSVFFFFLTSNENLSQDERPAEMKPADLEIQTVNQCFYILVSLCIPCLMSAFFLPWLALIEIPSMLAIIFIFLSLLSQLTVIIPNSFTLGEAAICSQALSYILFSFGALFLHHFNLAFTTSQHLHSLQAVIAFMQVAVTSALLVVALLYFIPVLRSSIGFYSLVLSVMAGFSLPCLYVCLKQDFVMWLITYIKQNSTKSSLFFFWAACLFAAVGIVLYNTRFGTGSITTSTRKQFHILSIAIIIPGLVSDVEITCLALTCAAVVFIMVETMRVLAIPPFGASFSQYILQFVDEQDQGPIILTPLYLLCGIAAPLWLFPLNKGPHLSLYSGVLSLGIGDTVAAVVGSKAGSLKWFGSSKTVEGSLANIASQIMALYFMNSYNACYAIVWPAAFFAITVTSLIEALTSQIDNLILPLVTYALLLAL